MPFESMVTPPDHMVGRPGLWFCIAQNTVLVHVEGGVRIPHVRHPEELGIRVDHEHFLGVLNDTPVWAGSIFQVLISRCLGSPAAIVDPSTIPAAGQ